MSLVRRGTPKAVLSRRRGGEEEAAVAADIFLSLSIYLSALMKRKETPEKREN